MPWRPEEVSSCSSVATAAALLEICRLVKRGLFIAAAPPPPRHLSSRVLEVERLVANGKGAKERRLQRERKAELRPAVFEEGLQAGSAAGLRQRAESRGLRCQGVV